MVKSNCKKCGAPLTKGNIKVVRKPGKRPFRIHRRCPEVVEVTRVGDRRKSFIPVGHVTPPQPWPRGETAGDVLQRPQDSTGGPFVVEGVFNYPDPPRYRYFVTRATAEKLQRAIKGAQVGITVEVIPVPEYQVEANPESLNDYVELTVNWKVE